MSVIHRANSLEVRKSIAPGVEPSFVSTPSGPLPLLERRETLSNPTTVGRGIFELNRRGSVGERARTPRFFAVTACARAHATSERLVAHFIAVYPERFNGSITEGTAFDPDHGLDHNGRFCADVSERDRLELEGDDLHRAVALGRVGKVLEAAEVSALVSRRSVHSLAELDHAACMGDAFAVTTS